jgi:ribosomal protein S27AE
MPADDASNVAPAEIAIIPSAIDPNQLLLHVTLGPLERAYLVQPGITIGRSPDNAICLEQFAMCWVHARVERVDERLRIVTCDYRWSLTLPDGYETRELFLEDGVEFRIDEARFHCAAAQVLILPRDAQVRNVEPVPPPVPESESLPPPLPPNDHPIALDDAAAIEEFLAKQQITCPRCSELLLLLPAVARFCPRCGTPLLIDGSAPPAATPRPATLVAYVNALLSLAHRFELGRDGDRNAAQALRYYRKAAKLGNGLARLRLSMIGSSRDTRA